MMRKVQMRTRKVGAVVHNIGFSNPLFAPNACFSLLAYMLKLATDARCFTVVLQFRHSIWKKETPEEILFVARHDVGGHCISGALYSR